MYRFTRRYQGKSGMASPGTCSIVASMNPADLDPRDLETLIAIMAALRTPGTGCPWDLEQDFRTIAPYTLEEAHEVAEAIEAGDRAALCEELGDLLLQVVFHARMAEEEGSFALPDVIAAITAKMIRRHPHVFGDEKARAAGVAKGFWETMKAKEKRLSGGSALAGVPAALPALSRAVKLQAKAARAGFDWPSPGPVLAKIAEEVGELRDSVADGDKAAIEEEFGDLMFALANLARHLGFDPEGAVRQANRKFERRFRAIEAELDARGKRPENSDLAEMDAIWDAVKAGEKG
jgi:MazG family protein